MDAVHGGLFISNISTNGNAAGNAQIGISVEPLTVITSKVPAEGTAISQQVWYDLGKLWEICNAMWNRIWLN